MNAYDFDVAIGSASASSKPGKGDTHLLSLVCELSMDSAGGRCSLELATPTGVAVGDTITVKLDGGAGVKTVFTGEVDAVTISTATVHVVGNDGLSKLARVELRGTWEKTHAGAIAKELLRAAAVTAGNVANGPKFNSYVLHSGPRALRHLQQLAETCGFDVYTDGDGKVHFAPPKTGGADHTFHFGKNLLDLSVNRSRPPNNGVVVWGEGAASKRGEDKAHWLVKDLTAVSGKASFDEATGAVKPGSPGARPLTIHDGAVRTGGDAAEQAKARATWLAAHLLRGNATVLGAPAVKPGDLVAIADLPKDHAAFKLLNGKTLRVRTVRHALDLTEGFVTRMVF